MAETTVSVRDERVQQIVRAAYRVVARLGSARATVKDIAREAGLAPGLIHYYFPSKDQVLVAVARAVARGYLEALDQVLEQRGLTPPGVEPGRAEQQLRDANWHRVLLDLYALGLHNPAVGAEIQRLLAEGRQVLDRRLALYHAAARAPGQQPGPGPGPAVPAALLAALDGLALQILYDPELDVTAALRAVDRLLPGR